MERMNNVMMEIITTLMGVLIYVKAFQFDLELSIAEIDLLNSLIAFESMNNVMMEILLTVMAVIYIVH